MERSKYLSIGLSFILAGIGAKLGIHALHKKRAVLSMTANQSH
jgi:predicted tellurium resistance membrane protein TerC